MIDMRALGEQLRADRRRSGLSQKRYARLLDLRQSQISLIETGTAKRLSAETLEKISRHISPEKIRETSAPPRAPRPDPSPDLRRESDRITHALDVLPTLAVELAAMREQIATMRVFISPSGARDRWSDDRDAHGRGTLPHAVELLRTLYVARHESPGAWRGVLRFLTTAADAIGRRQSSPARARGRARRSPERRRRRAETPATNRRH